MGSLVVLSLHSPPARTILQLLGENCIVTSGPQASSSLLCTVIIPARTISPIPPLGVLAGARKLSPPGRIQNHMSLSLNHYLDRHVKLYQPCQPSNNASHYTTKISFTIYPAQMHAQQPNYLSTTCHKIKASRSRANHKIP